jgi:hypothetical protein
VAAQTATGTAADVEPNDIVRRQHCAARLLSVTGSAQVIIEVFEAVANAFEIWLAFFEGTDPWTVGAKDCLCTPVCVPNCIDDDE